MRLSSLALAVLLLWSQPERGAATFTLPSYLAALDRVASGLAAASTPEEAHGLATALPDRWWVTVEGDVVSVDMRWIDAAVAGTLSARSRWPSVRERTLRRLSAMRAAGSETVASPKRAPDDILESVLARPEFHRSGTSRWLEEQRNRFATWVMRMLDRLSGVGLGGRTAAVVFAWAASVAALVALTWWLVTMLTGRSRAAALALGASPTPRTAAREWALRALSAARAGDLREAVRCGYHAALCRLDEQGAFTVDDSRTPREYLALLTGDDPRRSVLTDLTRQFEQVWYGRRTATIDDANRVSASLERLGCLRGAERAI